MSWNFMHKRGCGGVIFTYNAPEKPAETDLYLDTIRNSTYPDGFPVQPTDYKRCGTCGAGLTNEDLRLEFFEEVKP